MTEKKLAILAVGGNSLILDEKHKSVQDQFVAVEETSKHIAGLLKRGYRVVVTHGNGPQVGFILRRSELSRNELHEVPLDSCGADTQGAIGSAWEIIARCNAYVEESAPWQLAKDPEAAGRLDGVLYSLAEAIRIVSILISPFLPAPAAAIRAQLAWDGPLHMDQCAWGLLADGHRLGDPVPVFPRIG